MEADNVLLILICILGIIGNLIVIAIILILKEYKKTVTHWYILQLAIADTLFVATIPLIVSQRIDDTWNMGDSACKFKEAMLFINYYASIIFLTVMSVDRYIAVCHAFNSQVQSLRKPIVSYIVIVIVWILAILLSTPIIIYSHQGRANGNCACNIKFPPTQIDICVQDLRVANAREICTQLSKSCGSQSTTNSENPRFPTFDGFNFGSESPSNGSNSNFAAPEPTSSILNSFANIDSFSQNFPATNQQKTQNSAGGNFFGLTQETSGSNASFPSECTSTDDSPGWRGYVWLNFIVMFILPLMVMVFCYGMITNRFWNTSINKAKRKSSSTSGFRSTAQSLSKRKPSNRSAVDRDRRRVSIMCAVLVATFALCWVLYHSVQIAKLSGIHLSAEGCTTITKISLVLVYLNSALNPFLYSFLGTGCQRKWKMVRNSSAVRRMTTMNTKSSSARNGSVFTNKMTVQEQPMKSNVVTETQFGDENGRTEVTELK